MRIKRICIKLAHVAATQPLRHVLLMTKISGRRGPLTFSARCK